MADSNPLSVTGWYKSTLGFNIPKVGKEKHEENPGFSQFAGRSSNKDVQCLEMYASRMDLGKLHYVTYLNSSATKGDNFPIKTIISSDVVVRSL